MHLCIYGALPLSDGFGGKLSCVRPATTQLNYMVHCSVDSTPDSNIRYLLLDCKSKNTEKIALGICSWLSFRSTPRVSKFRIQCCDSTEVTSDAAANFVRGLKERISPQSTIMFRQETHDGSQSVPAPTLLMQLPSELRAFGDAYINKDTSVALGYYDSALSTMMHWIQYRNNNSEATNDWASLMFDLISSRLEIHIIQGQVIEMKDIEGDGYKRSLDLARDWCSSDLLAKEKRVTFLSRYAKAQEIWGSPETACILISVALKLDPENEKLRQKMHRLRSSLSAEVYSFLRDFDTIFSDPTPTFRVVEGDQHLLTKQRCSICLRGCSIRKRVEILSCKHVFHEDCILEWLKKSSGTCPLCREDF